ncbi:site-specific recombinase XerD [Spirosoma oryzae]|uniref:Site-specific recombinase XerD n=1 Tax=Spirosoma oryzae TaxID=1469603 RepID=A0A2T0SY79_9BACT|nr:site-specific integrase [Spirosoma oryzae]PRY38374.1 site-specific recombinase XerD [Spirosoma oryzae]
MLQQVKSILQKKKRATGLYPIMLRIRPEGKEQLISTGFTSKLTDWDQKKGRPKKSHPLFEEMMLKLPELELSVAKGLTNSQTGQSSRQILEKAVNKASTGSQTGVLEYTRETIKRLKAENRHGYANAFRGMELSLEKQLTKRQTDFQFSQLSPQFIRAWESSLRQKGCKDTTISAYFRAFRTMIGYARLEKLTTVNPFSGEDKFNMSPYGSIKTAKRAIERDKIELLHQLELEEDSPEFHARNFFMFSFFTRGMNLIDIARLEPKQKVGDYLEYRRAKTHQWQRVFMLDPAKDIWNYYLERMKKGQQTVFWFIFWPRHNTPELQRTRMQTVLKQINKLLRKLASQVGIETHLTTYVARHSFASSLKHLGIPTDQISELLGHDSVETTRIYLESFSDETLNEAVRKLL